MSSFESPETDNTNHRTILIHDDAPHPQKQGDLELQGIKTEPLLFHGIISRSSLP